MQEQQAEPTAEETGGAADATAQETGAGSEAAAIDAQASPGDAGEAVLREPEVPDDANDTIAAAQQHINKLNMDQEREAAKRAQKQL